MRTKKLFALVVSAIMILTMVACGTAPAASNSSVSSNTPASSESLTPADPAKTYTLKIGHTLAPATPQHQGLLKLESIVEERTNGAVQIEIYPSSQIGDERELIEGMMLGTVDGYLGSNATMTAWLSDFMVFDIPFVFDSYDHAFKCYDGEIGDLLKKECEDVGVHVLTFSDAGFSNFITNDKAIAVPDDAKGMNIRVMESPGLMAYMNAIGANPVPMGMSEVFTSLQNGTLDGGTWPIVVTYNNQYYTVIDYLTHIDAVATSIQTSISKSVWDTLPAEYQTIISEASVEAVNHQRQLLLEKTDLLLKDIKESGVTIVDADRAVWKDAVYQPCLDAMVPKYVPQELVDMINAAK